MSGLKVALVGHSDPRVPDWVGRKLADQGIAFVHAQCDTPGEVVQLAGDAQVLWTFGSNPRFTARTWCDLLSEALPGLAGCRVILRSGSGTDNVPVDQATSRGILVANTPAATAEPVAEFAITLMLTVARQIVPDVQRIARGDWSQPAVPAAFSLVGKTVGLVGFGLIAQTVARRIRGFDVRLLACDPVVTAPAMQTLGVTKVTLHQLLEQSDVISLHCPLLESTRNLISHGELARIKPTAILINTARGEVVDESALIQALRDKRLAGAGLDVLAQEPPPMDHPLLHMPNVVVTPHMAAFSEQIFHEMWQLSVQVILDLHAGRRPTSCVNQP